MRFFRSSNETKFMLFEAFVLLAWGRILKSVRFSKLAPKLGNRMRETSYEPVEEHHKILREISQAVYLASKYTFWESECLVKALAARQMLKRRGIESTLYLGTGRDEQRKLIAHAWLRSGPYIVTGSEGMEQFTMVATFANFHT